MAGNVYTSADAVVTSDSTVLRPTQALYVGGAGDVKVDMYGVGVAATVTFKAVPVGTLLPIKVTRVYATGTAATNILALR